MARPAIAILAICSLFLSGCGTFSDAMCGPVNGHVYYRGVRFDMMTVQEGGPNAFLAADIPLSALVDTLMIPRLAYLEMTNCPPGNAKTGDRDDGSSSPSKPSQ